MENTQKLLKEVQEFHDNLTDHYHPVSYAHYGNDPEQKSFRNVVWEIGPDNNAENIYLKNIPNLQPPTALPPGANPDNWQIKEDNGTGEVSLKLPDGEVASNQTMREFRARIRPPADSGDGTVPHDSADAQFRSGKFKGIFRQKGYEKGKFSASRTARARLSFLEECKTGDNSASQANGKWGTARR